MPPQGANSIADVVTKRRWTVANTTNQAPELLNYQDMVSTFY